MGKLFKNFVRIVVKWKANICWFNFYCDILQILRPLFCNLKITLELDFYISIKSCHTERAPTLNVNKFTKINYIKKLQ